jgi:hypothetical protein
MNGRWPRTGGWGPATASDGGEVHGLPLGHLVDHLVQARDRRYLEAMSATGGNHPIEITVESIRLGAPGASPPDLTGELGCPTGCGDEPGIGLAIAPPSPRRDEEPLTPNDEADHDIPIPLPPANRAAGSNYRGVTPHSAHDTLAPQYLQ